MASCLWGWWTGTITTARQASWGNLYTSLGTWDTLPCFLSLANLQDYIKRVSLIEGNSKGTFHFHDSPKFSWNTFKNPTFLPSEARHSTVVCFPCVCVLPTHTHKAHFGCYISKNIFSSVRFKKVITSNFDYIEIGASDFKLSEKLSSLIQTMSQNTNGFFYSFVFKLRTVNFLFFAVWVNCFRL